MLSIGEVSAGQECHVGVLCLRRGDDDLASLIVTPSTGDEALELKQSNKGVQHRVKPFNQSDLATMLSPNDTHLHNG